MRVCLGSATPSDTEKEQRCNSLASPVATADAKHGHVCRYRGNLLKGDQTIMEDRVVFGRMDPASSFEEVHGFSAEEELELQRSDYSLESHSGFPEETEPVQSVTYTQEIRNVLQLLEGKKKAAVRDEEFEKAKQFRDAIYKLNEASERIDSLNNEKRAAVEEEDYDKAEECKKKMNAMRARAYEEVELLRLLSARECSDLGLKPLHKRSVPTTPTLKRSESAPGSSKGRPPSGRKSNPYLDRDNMVLPAIRNQQKQYQQHRPSYTPDEATKLPPIDHTHSLTDDHYSPYKTSTVRVFEAVEVNTDEEAIYRLHPKDVAQLMQAMNAFGAKMVRYCTSKQWQERQKGLEELHSFLEQMHFRDREDAMNVLAPTLQLLTRALKDKIFNVYKEATDLLIYLLTNFLPRYRIAKAGGSLFADRTCSILVSRSGDTISDPRFRSTSMEIIEFIIKTTDPQIGKSYMMCLLRPLQSSGHQKIDQAHAELAERIIFSMDVPNTHLDLTEEKICPFAVSCLQHTDAAVRQTGIRVLSYIYKMGDREKVRRHVPRNTDATRKKYPLYKTLFDEFDCIDGKMGPPYVASLNQGRQGSQQQPDQLERLRRETEEIKRELTYRHLRPKTQSLPRRVRHTSHAVGTGSRTHSESRTYRDDYEKSCVFCGTVNSAFDDTMLDFHYLKHCPMLTKCQLCDKVTYLICQMALCFASITLTGTNDVHGKHNINKVVEICSLREHLLRQCAAKDLIRQCSRCKEPVAEHNSEEHKMQQECKVPGPGTERCPLCHKEVSPNSEGGWKCHLMGADGCESNPRKLYKRMGQNEGIRQGLST